MDEGLLPGEIGHQNRPKNEEKTYSGLSIVATKRKVKQEANPKNSVSGTLVPVYKGEDRKLSL